MSTLDSGQRVGRYRIVRFLGAGAMGEVYLADDPHIERRLAIKTVRLAGGRPQDIEDRKKRLLREARAAGRLLHPNVVTLFDTGEEDGLLFLAFEFVEGCDLASRLDSGEPPTLREALRIVRQVAEALDYAHRQGIVHRDIKPSNILIASGGHVKVADFGIAKVAGQNTELTVAGSVMGSPQYLSPEQIRGDELDGRSDIFSLGVVLYELLSGRRPFDGETITTLVYQILHKDPAISELRSVPLRLEQLLHRMLAKDRDDRLATAGLVAEELAAIERELPEAALAAPAAPAGDVLEVTRVMSSRSLPPGEVAVGAAVPAPATPGAGMPAAAPSATAHPPAPLPAAAAAGPPARGAAAAPPPVRHASSARLWLALGALLLLFCGAVGVGAFWLWQRYLRGAGPQIGHLLPASSASPAAPGPSAAPAAPATAGNPAPRASPPALPLPPPAPGAATPRSSQAPPIPPPAQRPAPPSATSGTPTTPVARPPANAAGGRSSVAGTRPPASSPAPGAARHDEAALPAGAPGSAGAGSRGGTGADQPSRPPATIADADTGQPSAADRDAATAGSGSGAVVTASADRLIHSGLELAFRVNPPDAFVLLDGAVIGRAQDWNGLKGGRSFTLPGTGAHVIKIKKPGMKDYRIAVEASDTRGVTPVMVNLQPLPAAQVDTSDLQTIRVREAIALRVQPEVNAVVLVDGNAAGPVRKFAGRFGHGDEWLSLPPGTHRVTVVAPGYGRRDLAVEITPGADRARQKVDVALSPATGNP